jgi:hypothetical protein
MAKKSVKKSSVNKSAKNLKVKKSAKKPDGKKRKVEHIRHVPLADYEKLQCGYEQLRNDFLGLQDNFRQVVKQLIEEVLNEETLGNLLLEVLADRSPNRSPDELKSEIAERWPRLAQRLQFVAIT